jgi:RNA polymerase sigma factor (sigma-70 family)
VTSDDQVFPQLVERLRQREPAALAELHARYGNAIRRVVRRHLPDRLRTEYDSLDFVQDVFSSFLALPQAQYNTFADADAIAQFLARVARNKVIAVYRKRFLTHRRDISREQPLDLSGDDAGGDIPSQDPGPFETVVARERWEQVVRGLPAGHRAIIERLREGHTQAEIAGMFGLSVSTIERIIRRIRDLNV